MKVQRDYTKIPVDLQSFDHPYALSEVKAINKELMQLILKLQVQMIFAFMPHLPPEKQNIKSVADILGKNDSTVFAWIAKLKGGEETK